MVLKMNEKISVIMGIYNCAETLEEALDCIVKQTYTTVSYTHLDVYKRQIWR